MNGTIGKRFLAAVVKESSVSNYLRFGDIAKLFKNHESPMYEFVDAHVKKHGVVPNAQTVLEGVKEDLPDIVEPSTFYFDQLRDRHIELTMKAAVQKAGEMLMPGQKEPNKALAHLTKEVLDLARQVYTTGLVDYRDAIEHVLPDYVSKIKGTAGGIELGWHTLDNMTGGLVGGDLVSYVGRPATGKSFNLLWSALHAWKNQKKVPLFISMEMKPLLLEQRLAAIDAKVPLSHVKLTGDHMMTTEETKSMTKLLKSNQKSEVPFWIVDGNLSTTVDGIYSLCRQLNPDCVYIDGAYLLKHSNSRLDRYTRVAENAELMKQALTDLNIPGIATWQFSREATKKKKGEKVGLEDIAYSDAIAQISSLVMALLEEDTVETLGGRRVDILKGRSGETGMFRTRWDFVSMSFEEIVTLELEDLKYV